MKRVAALWLLAGCSQILGVGDPELAGGGDASHNDGLPFDGLGKLDTGGPGGCATQPSFGSATNYGVTAGPVAFDVGDLDHDGLTDVVVVGMASSLVIMHGTGGGNLGRQQFVPLPAMSATGAFSVRAIDLDHDGFVDLVFVATGTDAALYAQRQDPTHPGTFLPAVHVADVGPMFIRFAVGDIDGDGLLDLATPNPAATGIFTFLQLPAAPGTFSAATQVTLGSTSGFEQVAALADLDHDGHLDVIGVFDGTVKYALQKPTGTFGSPISVGGTGVMDVAAGDVDGDGFDDVLVVTNQSTVFFQNPATPGTFVAGPTAPVLLKFPELADVNGDGRVDLIGNGQFLLQCAPPNPARTFLMQLLGQAIGYGDLNADGKLDSITFDPQNATMAVAIQQ